MHGCFFPNFLTCPGRCEADEYRCASGECIANDHLCDRITDCPDNADEEACGDGKLGAGWDFRSLF